MFWSKISLLEDEGGFGFKNMCILNQKYILKLAWNMVC